jgi:hypothetical protein
MAYAPTVNDNSGQILSGFQTQAADMRLAQQQQQAEAFANVAGSLTSAIADSQAKTAKLQGIQATGSAMQAILPQYGEEGMALGQALQSELGKAGTNPDKMAGAMMAFMPAMENLQTRFNQNNQYTQALNLAQKKAALGIGGGGSAPTLDVGVEGVEIWR